MSSSSDLSARQYAGENFLKYFFINLSGTGRLGLAKASAAEPVGSIPTSTIAALLSNDEARAVLSDLVLKAFGQYLVIDPTQMTQLRYMLSKSAPCGNIERHLTDEAVAFFAMAEPLEEASDGTKAFVGIAAEIIAGDPDVIVVDEPEAFLHPSLAFLLGRYVAGHIQNDKQLYVATHSSAFLLGSVLSGASVDVVRLTYRSGNATARHLSAERLKQLMIDPLFRSAGAVSALFYESAVITEGDSDRAFYDEINNRLQSHGDRGLGHNTFLNAHNKQTAVNLVVPLRQVGIPAAMILDLDWLKEDGQVWERYFSALGAPAGLRDGFAATRRYIRNKLFEQNPNYKTQGGVAVLSSSDQMVANDFLDNM
ncbi:MAG: ATP-binding protein, partial [Cytophagaceae bacterium]